jgi:hypothetical protein
MSRTDWGLILGPDGRKECLRFQLQMVTVRVSQGLEPKDLRAKLAGLNFNPEGGSLVWAMADVQEWCKALGGRLQVSFPGVPEPDQEELDQITELLRLMYDQDTFDRWYAVRYLGLARVSAGLDSKTFAQKIGLSVGGVTSWEGSTDSPMIPTLVRHARGLGGGMRLDFLPNELVQGPKGRIK